MKIAFCHFRKYQLKGIRASRLWIGKNMLQTVDAKDKKLSAHIPEICLLKYKIYHLCHGRLISQFGYDGV